MARWLLPPLLQAALAFFQPTTETISVVTGIQPVIAAPDQLWQQCFTDANLDTAKDWLLKQSREQDHSDTWDYVRHWAVNKTDLQQRLMDNRFHFQAVREIEINDEQG